MALLLAISHSFGRLIDAYQGLSLGCFHKFTEAERSLKKTQNIQALRGVAVLLVVLFHLAIVEKKYGGVGTILPEILNFGMFGVDLFFVISGFVMVTVTRGAFQSVGKSMQFLYHRASRIYPAYWVYSLLVLLVFLVKPSLVNSSQGNEVNILASFLLWPTERLPLLMIGWTLIHEIYFYVVFFVVLLLMRESHLVYALLSWMAVILCANIFYEFSIPALKIVFHLLTLEFILGCFVALFFYRITALITDTRISIIIAVAGFVVPLYGQHVYSSVSGQVDPQGWWRILIFGVPAVAMVFGLVGAERGGFVLHPFLIKMGDASYSIYLSHLLTLSVLGRLWKPFATDSVLDNWIMIPTILILTIVVGMVSFRYIERPLLVLTRKFA